MLVLARLIALIIHEVAAPVVAEYRKLDTPPCADGTPDGHRYDPASVTSIETDRAAAWDHDTRRPVTAARFGFGP